MEQPVPEVDEADVRRVVARDFGTERLEEVLAILRRYRESSGAARVRLAILKLAGGDLDRLIRCTEVAVVDFRDVVGAAEYPSFMTRFGVDLHDRDAAIAEDWRNYQDWLSRP